MKDALGNNIEIGKYYGYSITANGFITVVTGRAKKVTELKCSLSDVKEKRGLYGEVKNEFVLQDRGRSVYSCNLFPVSFENTAKITREVNDGRLVEYQGFLYKIKPAEFDLSTFDYDGQSEIKDYYKEYIIIDNYDGEKIRINTFEGIYDEKYDDSAFNPENPSEFILTYLADGDECYIDDMYEIVATNNVEGKFINEVFDKEIISDYIKSIADKNFK